MHIDIHTHKYTHEHAHTYTHLRTHTGTHVRSWFYIARYFFFTRVFVEIPMNRSPPTPNFPPHR